MEKFETIIDLCRERYPESEKIRWTSFWGWWGWSVTTTLKYAANEIWEGYKWVGYK